ncbi:hypothetical protein Aeqsu_0377 [Aequorivita sublithincola DSM 14238]|uniref:Uncharacterized protein n=1 Tax=Aequorivita sublithincola (strain DSM 14238 / LMG 21431 / ACAM 643 / 9-3) TaxID=746697 RepID=I3YSC2_AEQSU|nr:hypothetical protein [Aequorivita sublithincola]AFL79890.1 hypothetical protein Aeqsu_0377 [Aequorivita sublithincola DSM 14238]
MKIIVVISIFTLQLFLSCKTADLAAQDLPVGQQDVVKEDEEPKQQSLISIEELIGSIDFNVLEHSDTMKVSNIKSVVIEGTEVEFGRKLELIKDFKFEDDQLLNNILNNENYIEVKDANFPFNPTLQFQLNHEDQQLLLLLDEETGTISFTSVQGQTVLKIAETLKEELIELAN